MSEAHQKHHGGGDRADAPLTTVAGALLYAQDHVRVARFYREVLALALIDSDNSHTRLRFDGFELVVHAGYSAGGLAAGNRRGEAALRLIFAVPDVAACRKTAAAHGGQIDDDPPIWAGPDASLRLGHDPEGNIFEVQPR